MVYITPQVFLPTGATIGLSYFGKDTENWVSRFLLYSLKSNMPSLLGYVVFDVGKNFSEDGCYIYKQLGGCTNPKRLKFNDYVCLLKKSFLFTLPSLTRQEAFGMVLIEALSVGLPIINFDIEDSGVNFVNKNNVTGFNIEYLNYNKFYNIFIIFLK